MSEKIKACAFCPVPTVTMVFNPDGDDAFVECSRCKTQGPSGKNEAEAIAKWNAAANALEQKDAEIARLIAACDDLEGEYLRMKDERDEAKVEIEKLRLSLTEANAKINQYKGHAAFWPTAYCMAIAERDEARRVARRLYATNKELIDTFARQLERETDDFDDVLIDFAKKKEYYTMTLTRNEPPTSRVDETERDT